MAQEGRKEAATIPRDDQAPPRDATTQDVASSSTTSTPRRSLAVSSPDEHLVTSPLPLWSDPDPFPTKHWAGHLPASSTDDKYFFYWLFEPPTTAATATNSTVPLIIWLNGGPGCSSMDGLWIENGPFRLGLVNGSSSSDSKPTYGVFADKKSSWHLSPAYTLYVDQPVGTGLSYTRSKTYPANDEEVNVDFYHFLQSFFQLHSDKFVAAQQQGGTQKMVNRPLYFSGESHAGHYIPSMMNYILGRNDQLESGAGGGSSSSTDIVIPVSGAASTCLQFIPVSPTSTAGIVSLTLHFNPASTSW
jgi:carboxypeptidase C (cathepsin A)